MITDDTGIDPVVHVDSGETGNGGLDLPAGTQKSDEVQEEREKAHFEYHGNDEPKADGTDAI